MAVATSPIIPKDGVLTFADATGSPITWAVVYEDGDFSIGEIEEGDYEHEVFWDRHEPYSVRKTKKKIYEWSFTAHLVAFTDSHASPVGNALDVVRFKGAFLSAISTGGASNAKGDAALLQLTWATERTDFGGTADGSMVLKYNRLSASIQEGTPSTITISGKSIPFSTDHFTIAT